MKIKNNFILCTIFNIFRKTKRKDMAQIQELCHRMVISINEARHLKNCSRQTIYNNRGQFDWDGNRIIRNDKFINWQPLSKGRPRNEAG